MSFYKKTLDNGITIKSCKMENTHSVTIILSLKGGAAWEPISQKGITHLVEHLCFRRCNGMEQKKFYYQIERVGGWLRGVTYRDSVLFEITVHPKYFNEAISIISSLFYENGWTNEDIRKEKAVVCREIDDRNSWAFHQIMYEFFEHKSAGDFIAGTQAKVMRLSKPQLVKWKKQLFATNNATIIITGNMSDIDIENAHNLFAKVPKNISPVFEDIMPKSFLSRKNTDDKYFTDDCNYIKIALSFDIDYKKISVIQAEILESTLCRGHYAPFDLRLREDLGLIYETESNVEFYNFGGQLYFIFDVHKDKALLLLDEVTALILEQKRCLNQKAFECVKTTITDGKENLLVSPRDFAYLIDDKITTPQSYLDKNRAVTYQEVQQAARDIFKTENMLVVLHDIPDDEQFYYALYEKKELLRKKLGE